MITSDATTNAIYIVDLEDNNRVHEIDFGEGRIPGNLTLEDKPALETYPKTLWTRIPRCWQSCTLYQIGLEDHFWMY